MSLLLDKNPLIVVGDAARVRLFSVNASDGHLIEDNALVNTAAHQHTRDLQADRDGRAVGGRHAMTSPTGAKEQATAVFAREVAAHLQHMGEPYRNIVLIAAPKFLGLLRKQLTQLIKSRVAREINKDLTTSTLQDIESIVICELRNPVR